MKVKKLNNISDQKLAQMLVAEDGYAYHITTLENAQDILETGEMGVYPPDFGTEQDTWPDGKTELRSYWGKTPNLIHFAPEGDIVMLRANSKNHQVERGTNDLYLTSPLPACEVEIFSDALWQSIDILNIEQLEMFVDDESNVEPNLNIDDTVDIGI